MSLTTALVLSVFLPIISATIVAIGLGMIWFSSFMFGRTWMVVTGVTQDKMTEAQKKGFWKYYVMNMLLTFVTASVVFLLIRFEHFILTDVFAMWCAFSLPLLANDIFWEGKPLKLFLIKAGYSLVALAFMSQVIMWMI